MSETVSVTVTPAIESITIDIFQDVDPVSLSIDGVTETASVTVIDEAEAITVAITEGPRGEQGIQGEKGDKGDQGEPAADTFESISQNIRAYDKTNVEVDGELVAQIFDLGGGLSIRKDFNVVDGELVSIILSGDLPDGIATTKTFTPTGVVYS